MPYKIPTALALALSLLSGGAHASDPLEKYLREGGAAKPEKIVSLPFGKMLAAEGEGKILYMSENGRFVLSGRMIDLWEKKEITSVSQLENVYATINLRRMGFEPEKLNTLIVGSGAKEVTFFVDPTCEPCHALMSEAIELSEQNKDQYRFNFIVVPALGDHANLLAKGMFCSTDTDKQKLDALLKNTIPTLTQPESCDTAGYNLTLIGAQSLGIDGVPFLINHDGVPYRGKPANLKNWLEGKK